MGKFENSDDYFAEQMLESVDVEKNVSLQLRFVNFAPSNILLPKQSQNVKTCTVELYWKIKKSAFSSHLAAFAN